MSTLSKPRNWTSLSAGVVTLFVGDADSLAIYIYIYIYIYTPRWLFNPYSKR